MKTIMIIDDKPDYQQLNSFLNTDDICIKTVSTPRKALEELQQNEEINLVLVNTTIPDLKKNGYLPINPTKMSHIDTTDVNNYLIKPFTKTQLHDFIKQSLHPQE